MKRLMTHKAVFAMSFIASLTLMIVGFIIPPTGVIDGSVLTACGILFAFAALAQLPTLMHGRNVNIEHGQTSIRLDTIEQHEGNN